MSQQNRNPFGGKNPHGMYVPLTDTELEVLERLADAQEFKVVVKDWGFITGFQRGRYNEQWHMNPTPLVVFGDKRISFYFRMNFNAPIVPQPNWYFDMEVWALGHRLFSQRLPTEHAGKPIQVAAGMFLDMALDVALDRIDPKIVKEVMPKAWGLTTKHGNMKLDSYHKKLLAKTQAGEKKIREITKQEAQRATLAEKKATSR